MEIASLELKVSTAEAEAGVEQLQLALEGTEQAVDSAGKAAKESMGGIERAAAAAERSQAALEAAMGEVESAADGVAGSASDMADSMAEAGNAAEEAGGAGSAAMEDMDGAVGGVEGAILALIAQLQQAEQEGTSAGDAGAEAMEGWASSATKAKLAIGSVVGALGGLAGAFMFLRKSFTAFEEQEQVTRQLEAALISTRGAAGLTLIELQHMSNEMQQLTGISNETVESAQSLMLTYTNINRDVFPRTLALAADMSARFGRDLTSSAQSLGRAMNDPIRGMLMLTRVGIDFSQSQQDMIKELVESGRLLEAQTLILDEIEGKFGGAAAAAASTLGGALRILRENWADVVKEFGRGLFASESLDQAVRDLAKFLGSAEFQQNALLFGRNLRESFLTGASAAVTAYRIIGNGVDQLGMHFSMLIADGDAVWAGLKNGAETIWDAIVAFSTNRINDLVLIAKEASIKIQEAFELMADFIRVQFEKAVSGASTAADKAVNVIGKILQKFPGDVGLAGALMSDQATRNIENQQQEFSSKQEEIANRARADIAAARKLHGEIQEDVGSILAAGVEETRKIESLNSDTKDAIIDAAQASINARNETAAMLAEGIAKERARTGDGAGEARPGMSLPDLGSIDPIEVEIRQEGKTAMELIREIQRLREEAGQAIRGDLIIISPDQLRDYQQKVDSIKEKTREMLDFDLEAHLAIAGPIIGDEVIDDYHEQLVRLTAMSEQLGRMMLEGPEIPADALANYQAQLAAVLEETQEVGRGLEEGLKIRFDDGLIDEDTLEAARANMGMLADLAARTGNAIGENLKVHDKNGFITDQTMNAYRQKMAEMQKLSEQVAARLAMNQVGAQEAIQIGFQQTVDSWGTMSERMATVGAGLASSMERNITDGLMGIIDGTMSVQEAFSKMAQAIIQDLIRIMIQQLIVRSVMSAFGGGGGVMHEGGIVGGATGPAPTSGAWQGAPRYESGGVAGDEVPILAHRGEVIFNEEQFGALMAGQRGGREQRVEILNVTDPSMIDERIAANPNSVLNVIGRNRQQVKAALGLR